IQSSYVYKDPNNDPRWLTNWPYDEVYLTKENHFTNFSFSGQIVVQVTMPLRTTISTVTVHPLSKNVKATISGNVISIPISSAGNYYLEVDGEARFPLFIFANPLETNVPSATDPNVIYYAPGIYDVGYDGGAMQSIPVGKTVYLAGGAYVKGRFKTTGVAGTTTFRGRGILSGINIPGYSTYRGMIDAYVGSVNVEGITILDSPQGYQGIIAYGSNSIVKNIKMIAWAMESDVGVLGNYSLMQDCFLKINDDILKPISIGMIIKDNVVWQQMAGSVIQLGWNSTDKGINATVSGLDIIACDRGAKTTSDGTVQAIINLKNDNGATYTNMVIENIRMDKKIYMFCGVDIKQTDPNWVNNSAFNLGLGSIDGITFRNISIPQMPARISYFNGNGNVTSTSTGDIKNITFENLTVGGTLVTSANAANYITISGKASNFFYTAGSYTDIQNVSLNESPIKIYPNPVLNELNVEIQETNSKVAIYNSTGQKLIEKISDGKMMKFDVDVFSKGIYLVKVNNEISGKFIK
ncbi:MAG: T9SS type A sorting domain-containing protein, partial [Bacteroidota bacterium]